MHAQVRPSRLQPSSDNDYRYASRSVPLPNLEEKDVPSEIEPPHAMSAAKCRKVPQSAARNVPKLGPYAPLYGRRLRAARGPQGRSTGGIGGKVA